MISVFQAYYEETLLKTTSPSAISWIGSLQAFFLFGGILLGGPLFDRYGATVLFFSLETPPIYQPTKG